MKSQNSNVAALPSAEQQDNETISVLLEGKNGTEANLDEELLLRDKFLLDEQIVLSEEACLTLVECSRQVSAYTEHHEWQDFLNCGHHTTTQTAAVETGWNGLKLDTVGPADEEAPFPALTTTALKTLMQLSPTVGRLYQQLRTGKDPLADKGHLTEFLKKADHNNGELFASGNHSLVIKWRKGPGYVLKIACSEQDNIRLNREKNLHLWLRHPDNVLLNLSITPMRAAFSVAGKPVLALTQVDDTARDRLRLMGEHHSLNERLNFALSVVRHFCLMYRRFLEKDVLLADRHDDNIGFIRLNEPLQGRKNIGQDEAIVQIAVMLDPAHYWFGGQELRKTQLRLPTWVPVLVGLLEGVFTPVNSNSQISESRAKVIDKIQQSAFPVFFSSSSSAPEIEEGGIEPAIQSCINHWFQNASPEYSRLLAEARSHIEPLLTSLKQWDSTPRTVAEWNKRLRENIEKVLQWLNNWEKQTKFSLLQDFADKGTIRVPSAREGTSPQNQQLLTQLSTTDGKLDCQKCSRTFTTSTEFKKHREHHRQKTLRHCQICDGDFTHITDHMRVHTGEKPFKCRICGKCFSESGNLQTHLRTHSRDKPFKCRYCSKCFSQNGHLKIHLRNHSGEKP